MENHPLKDGFSHQNLHGGPATGISQLAMFDGGYYAHVTCPVVTAQKW
jgi:hypothetical protein